MQLQIAAATWRIERKRFRLLPNYFRARYYKWLLCLSVRLLVRQFIFNITQKFLNGL